MNKDTVYKAFFETVNESLDWADCYKNNEYYNYIDGIAAMTQTILDKFKEEVEEGRTERE